ncbi:type ISP restriction/modification enzyme [Boseongicola sp. H5]|uniref:type ISP restriction/modification enzyme n=1 Tax=Boseongicola sp. H5 TaxID=2763261 RepID=UPI001D0A3B15|nr:type ISP restriction/modification enzyme [Boseongicola sp. H5]
MTIISDFIARVQDVHKTNIAREHAYRPALHDLLKALGDDLTPVNDPAKSAVGAPDFIVLRDNIAIGHLEAKDIDIDIRNLKDANKRQHDRYVKGLANLIYTNCLDWDFYRNGQLVASITIGDYMMGIQPKPDTYAQLENLLLDFIAQRPQTITSPKDLAERMAGKAILIKDVLFQALRTDTDLQSELTGQYQAFREHLIHDIAPEDFADIYAETIAYGMFAARLHDTTLETFSRQEALDLLPKSNPFLRSLFSYVAGADLDDRIAWIIDDLAAVFQAANVSKIMENFGKLTGQKDPFLHFYETFLAAYNPAKRKARGVWYTPEPVVNFIVRAVDEVLQTEFGLPDGLADTSKVTIDWDTGQTDKKGKAVTIKKDVHRVQILDPATGTGTFLAEVIKQIAPKVKGVAPGMWSQYIEDDLIPRLHGFELLMASYAMCHMKLDMILTEMGYKPTSTPPRLSVYLTNSLEEGEPANQTLPFTQWLSREAKGANTIKRDMPIMCVIGNPPYSGISHNMGDWITNLIEDYKYIDGVHFGERKHWLQDDYVKFIRLSESLIEKNGEGILGFITNHGYLDNPTFRGMRWHLLNTFDRIHVIDLHGNANKKEVTPEGKPDKNVFDIQQGVAIIIAVKTGNNKKKGLAEVWHGDFWGTREGKYACLEAGRIGTPVTNRIDYTAPQYAFVPRDHTLSAVYAKGFGIADFMPANVTGIVTAKDGLVIDFTKQGLKDRITRFADPAKTDDQVRAEFFPNKKAVKYPPGDSRGWKLPTARAALQSADWASDITSIAYRPFDTRAILYRPDMVDWGRFDFMHHMLNGENFGLITPKIKKDQGGGVVTNMLCGHKTYDAYDSNSLFPLYLYPDEQELDQTRRVNFDRKLYERLQEMAAHPDKGTPDEIAVFDYIYGVLHCPAYRETFAEFLKIDFPRIPWPTSPDEFWDVSAKGTDLRKLHLMDPATIGQTPYPFTGDGDNVVDKPSYADGKVWINKTQYFDNAPEVSWGFYIGGYQPAQKWLKDRKGRALTFDDVKHYQRILKILAETDRIMKTITMDLSA